MSFQMQSDTKSDMQQKITSYFIRNQTEDYKAVKNGTT